MRHLIKEALFSRWSLIAGMLSLPFAGFSQTADTPAPTGQVDYTMAYVLIIVMLLLLVIIWFLTKLLETSSDYFLEKWKQERREDSSGKLKTIATLFFLFTGLSTFAQGTAAPAAASGGTELIAGIPYFLFYMMVCLILIEFVVILVLIAQIRTLMINKKFFGIHTEEEAAADPNKLSWWDRFNSFRPITSEAEIDLGHDYDGIRELNNKLPKWWLYGFYFTILAGVIYMYRYHISHSGLSNIEEYEASVALANKQKEATLKSAGNTVDETTVTMLTAQADLDAGAAVYKQNCVVCHGDKGQGLVGPNLTDNYWIYGGHIKDVFKTIKLGTNKGMQSWKENLSAAKIAQVASYIMSLKGTNPPNPKAPQGDLYVETAAAADTTATAAADTTKQPGK